MKKNVINSLIVIFVFVFAYYGRRPVFEILGISFDQYWLRMLAFYLWWTIPALVITGILYSFKDIFSNLGFDKGFLTGLWVAAISVLPMFAGSAFTGAFVKDTPVIELLHGTLFAGFFEEFLFRGFLFGLLFNKNNWGFIPAALLGALIFGSGHMYQGNTLSQTIGVFIMTALGAAWFSWLYIEWKNNLWVPVFLHIFMNLSWTLFDVSDNALGTIIPNLFRAATIAVSIMLTLKLNPVRRINRTVLNRNSA